MAPAALPASCDAVQHAGFHGGEDLGLILHHRLEQGNRHAGTVVLAGARGDVLTRADEHERLEQLVGDGLRGAVIVLGAPELVDLVAQLLGEPRSGHGDVREDGDHVDHEGLALGPVQSVAPRIADVAEQVAAKVDG